MPGGPSRWAAQAGVAGLRGAIVATVVLGLCFSMYSALGGLVGRDGTFVAGTLPAVAAAVVLVLAAIFLARREHAYPTLRFLAVTLAASILLRLGYMAVVEPTWVSDFGRYWRVANEMASADGYLVKDIYHQRALPYLVPVAELFGPSQLGLKLSNILTLTLVQLLGYDILRRGSGHQAAQCFSVLWLAAPEPLFSLAIPSHDLVSTGQFAVVAWLLAVLVDGATHASRRPRWLLYAIPLAVLLAILELQRGIGLIVLAVVLATGAVAVVIDRGAAGTLREGPRGAWRLLSVALLCVPLYAGSMALASRMGATMPANEASAKMLHYTTAHASSLSDGSYAWMVPFHATFAESFDDPEHGADFRRSLVLSDLLEDPLGRVANATSRLERLYQLGGSLYFYTAGYSDRHPQAQQAIRSYVHAFALLFAFGGVVAIVALLIRPRAPIMALLLLLVAAAITLSLVLVAENQPRYLYVIWFVGAAAIGFGFARKRPPGQPGLPPSRVFKQIAGVLLQTVVVVVFGLAAAWGSIAPWFDAGSGRILSDWALVPWPALATAEDLSWRTSLENAPSDVLADAHRRYRPRSKQFGPLALTLSLPRPPIAGHRVEASRLVCPEGGSRDDLAFFVYTPYKQLRRRGAFSLEVSVDGERRWSLPLPHADKAVAVEIPNLLPLDRCSRLSFTLRSNVTNHRASWQRASRIEIYFPRLVDSTP